MGRITLLPSRPLLHRLSAKSLSPCGDRTSEHVLEVGERRLVDAVTAVAAGKVARRSATQLGNSGLPHRTGYRPAQEPVRVTTGATFGDAATGIRVGLLTTDAVSGSPIQPWLKTNSQTLGLSVAAADTFAPRRPPSMQTVMPTRPARCRTRSTKPASPTRNTNAAPRGVCVSSGKRA